MKKTAGTHNTIRSAYTELAIDLVARTKMPEKC